MSRSKKSGDESRANVSSIMPSFMPQIGTKGITSHSSQISNIGALEQFVGYQGAESTKDPLSQPTSSSNQLRGFEFQLDSINKSLSSFGTSLSAAIARSQRSHIENGGDLNMPDHSPQTDISTDISADEKNEKFDLAQTNSLAPMASDSSDRSKEKVVDQKTLRRLAQNREAARKSRLRKKAYVQQLESSRLKLTQLEQELQRARQRGMFISNSSDPSHASGGNGALVFDAEYSRWLEEHNRQINELRSTVKAHATDVELRTIVENVTTHYEEVFKLKGNAAKADVFQILSGMWKTPAERCFMWIGGFRSSEILKLLASQLEPLTEQQLTEIHNLQQSSQQAEDALSQGMEGLQQSLAETLANGTSAQPGSSGKVANYMGQMAMAMGKLGTLEGFVRQADNLRRQTLQQMHQILTTKQSARALLAIHDYFSCLRALSSLWLARPQE